ncbi:MAG: lipid kinase, partial [Prevotellaceae bacterium]|nr:lipid kinase [Candidatus Colivivens equi]
KYFLNCINIGLGAKIVEILEKFTRLTGSKLLSIIPAALTNLLVQKNFTVKMNADNELVEMNVLSICIGNCHGYGQTPNSVPYNNRLDMSIILRPKWWQLAEGFWLLSKGKFLNYKNVRPYRLEKIVIDDISRAKVSLDGTSLDVKHPAPMRVGLEHEALNFIV